MTHSPRTQPARLGLAARMGLAGTSMRCRRVVPMPLPTPLA